MPLDRPYPTMLVGIYWDSLASPTNIYWIKLDFITILDYSIKSVKIWCWWGNMAACWDLRMQFLLEGKCCERYPHLQCSLHPSDDQLFLRTLWPSTGSRNSVIFLWTTMLHWELQLIAMVLPVIKSNHKPELSATSCIPVRVKPMHSSWSVNTKHIVLR